jgi:hypothetical protein
MAFTFDDKTPFEELNKCSNTYVEVEHDAEYFISVQRVEEATKYHLCCV